MMTMYDENLIMNDTNMIYPTPEYLIDANNNQSTTLITSTNSSAYQSRQIKDFYKDSYIFVTGGTGFLGKVLIEKLLYSCNDIKIIYVLLRPKRGLTSDQRYKEFIRNPVFDRIRLKSPEVLDKLMCVSGDITQNNIGLDECDLHKLSENVNIVFHVAATVRFDEGLKAAANLNTLGTQRVMELCSKMINIKSIVHVSTAYSNPSRSNVGEVVYPPVTTINEESFLKCVEILPSDVLDSISTKLQGSHPNTYTLTKSMAEQIVSDYSQKLPICIVRPSIVTSSIQEPFPGWIDNISGITGIMMEIGRGTISSVICEDKCLMDLIPVDIVVNTMIAAAWSNNFYFSNSIRVYNCTSGQINGITWERFGELTLKYARKIPTKYVMLYPEFTYRKNLFVHKIVEIFFHFLPAFIFDIIMRMQGSKPIMMKIATKFQKAAIAGTFFAMKEWVFDTHNLKQLIADVNAAKDGDEFNCNMEDLDWEKYVENFTLGIRKYVLKDSTESLPCARRKVKRLLWVKRFMQMLILYIFYYIFLKNIF